MTLKSILAGLAIVLTANNVAGAEQLRLGNFQSFAQGQYHAYPGLWSLNFDDTLGLGRKAVEGADFISTMTLDKSTFPHGSIIDWSVPNTAQLETGVYGYLQLAFGNYHGSRVPQRVQPAQVNAIEQLDVSLSYTYGGDNRFNLLNELYLLSDPTDADAIIYEVGIFARASSEMVRYFEISEQIGTYRDEQGREWKVAKRTSDQGGYFIMLIPLDNRDVIGSFNWIGVFDYLEAKGLLDGTEWFTGMAAGVEPVAGTGRVHIGVFAVHYRVGG